MFGGDYDYVRPNLGGIKSGGLFPDTQIQKVNDVRKIEKNEDHVDRKSSK